MTRRRGEPGRLRWKLSELLREKGIEVSPYDIWGQQGSYRGKHWDLAPWGATGKWIAPTEEQSAGELMIAGWDTMTDCVKWGIEIDTHETGHRLNKWEIEVHRAQPTK